MKPVFEIEGLTLAEFAAIAGASRGKSDSWLRRNGYGYQGGKIKRHQPWYEVEAELDARRYLEGPTAPCIRCGARFCDHQGARAA